MTYTIKQSSTEAALLFFLVESSDHITGLTGATATVTLSKNGAAFASPSGAVTEISSGWYKVAANATDTNTLGPLALHATAASGDPCDILVANIVAYDPQDAVRLGLSALPNASPGAANGVLIAGTNAATTIDGLTLTGTAASGATPATAGLTVTGGAASTTSGGVAAAAIAATGGAGAASTNGAAAGFTSTAGGTTTVSGNDGVTFTGTGNGNGLTTAKAGTGKDFNAQTTNALQVNATAINAVSTSSVTTVSAILGTTTAITFDANNLPKVDVEDWKAGVVPAVNVTGVPLVDVKYTLGTLSAGTAGYVGLDWAHISAPTTAVDLSGTTIKNLDNNPPGYPTNFNLLSIDGSGFVAIQTADRPGIRKNTALNNFEFLMTDSTNHNPLTGATVAVTRSIDGGAFGAGTLSAVTEIAFGIYAVNFAAADLNGGVITLRATATGADDLDVTIVTTP